MTDCLTCAFKEASVSNFALANRSVSISLECCCWIAAVWAVVDILSRLSSSSFVSARSLACFSTIKVSLA